MVGDQLDGQYSLVVDRGRDQSLERKFDEVEVGRVEGKEGVRVQGDNVPLISGVVHDMTRCELFWETHNASS